MDKNDEINFVLLAKEHFLSLVKKHANFGEMYWCLFLLITSKIRIIICNHQNDSCLKLIFFSQNCSNFLHKRQKREKKYVITTEVSIDSYKLMSYTNLMQKNRHFTAKNKISLFWKKNENWKHPFSILCHVHNLKLKQNDSKLLKRFENLTSCNYCCEAKKRY